MTGRSSTLSDTLKSPYPWFGGKSRVAAAVWERFGNVQNYIEPFFGSGAALLGRPVPFNGAETVNDLDGLVCNFWRALKVAPDEVAKWADNPVNENDVHARHFWLVERKDSLQARLEGDPDYFDAKIAGWWCWGLACWIGYGFCSGQGPWAARDVDGVRQLVNLDNAGQGVNRSTIIGSNGIRDWMQALAARVSRVLVCCGDWRRVCGGDDGEALNHLSRSGNKCAVFLDPPYSAEAGRDAALYRKEDLEVAHEVREWAVDHGGDPRLRIALCGYDGEHEMPGDWKVLEWKTQGGYTAYAALSDGDSAGKQNCRRERVWFSPHCLEPEQGLFGFGGGAAVAAVGNA